MPDSQGHPQPAQSVAAKITNGKGMAGVYGYGPTWAGPGTRGIFGRHATDVPVLPQASEQTWIMHHHDNPRWAWQLSRISGARG
jgi:hypothetical protein